MTTDEHRSVNLRSEQAAYVDELVASGAYASETEVVGAALEALQDRDAVIGRWLREEVVPTYERMKTDPSRGIPAEEVAADLEARHAAWMAS